MPAAPSLPAFWASALLAFALVAVKASYVGLASFWEWATGRDYFSPLYLSWAAAASRADLLFALAVGSMGVLASRMTARRARIHSAALLSQLTVGSLLVAYAIVGRQMFAHFGSQLTIQLFTIGGDFAQLRDCVLHYATPLAITASFGLPVLYISATLAMWRISRSWTARRASVAYVAGLCAAGAWLLLGQRIEREKWFVAQDRYVVENPQWTMLASLLPGLSTKSSLAPSDERDPEYSNDFGPPARRAAPDGRYRAIYRDLETRPLKNVIVLVLESVGSHPLTLYDGSSTATPRLAAEARHAAVFDNYYTPVAWTAYALTSILYGIHPPLRPYKIKDFEIERIDVPSIAAVLHARGYRTAFLAAGNPHWANQGVFEDGAFDTIMLDAELTSGEPGATRAVNDRDLFDGIKTYLDTRDARPFFLFAWTDQTHHPYDLGSAEANAASTSQERYLAIIRVVDGYIGDLLNDLRARQLAEDTLVVITGDHGEAFGRLHGTLGHGFSVHDEEVKVPLMLWNPRLFESGTRISTVGSHTDLAPTVTDLLGVSPAAGWQGRSLFAADRTPRVYLFAGGWGEYLLGVRENDWKYVVDGRRGTEEYYDLRSDPLEQHNLVPDRNPSVSQLRRRLAAMLRANRERLARK